jgi:hypothetical protein
MKPTRKYWTAIQVSLAFQIFLCIFAVLVADFGQIAYLWLITMAAFWGGVIMIMARRPANPTKLDLFLIRWAFPFLFLLAIPLTALIWKMRGFLE